MWCLQLLSGDLETETLERVLVLLAVLFDGETKFNHSNRGKLSDKQVEAPLFAAAGETPYGWLSDSLNAFATDGGFNSVNLHVQNLRRQDALPADVAVAAILVFKNCTTLMHQSAATELAAPVINTCVDVINNLTGKPLRDLATYLVQNESVLPEVASAIKTFRSKVMDQNAAEGDSFQFLMGIVLKLLKGDSYNGVMFALNEVKRILDDVEPQTFSQGRRVSTREAALKGQRVVEWLLQNDVMAVMLRDNLHQAQYVEKVHRVIKFYIDKKILSSGHLDSMWEAQNGKFEAIVINIHDLLAKLAWLFDSNHLDHLLLCFERTWGGSIQNMEKLLELMCRLAQDDSEGILANKVLKLLWDLAHKVDTPKQIVEVALQSHLKILDTGYIQEKEVECQGYMEACIINLRRSEWEIYAIRHLQEMIRILQEDFDQRTSFPTLSAAGSKEAVNVTDYLQRTQGLISLIVDNLVAYMREASVVLRNTNAAPPQSACVRGDFTHETSVNERLKFLRNVLEKSNTYMDGVLASQIWHILVGEWACRWDRDTCFGHFEMMFAKDDLHFDDLRIMFTQNVLALEPTQLNLAGFRCFQSSFEKVNYSNPQNDAQAVSQVVGLPFLWRVGLECPDVLIASQAIELLKRVHIELSQEDGVRAQFVNDSLQRLLEAQTALATAATNAQGALLWRTVERILTLLKSTVTDCDDAFLGERTYVPHGASFQGAPLTLHVVARFGDDRVSNRRIQVHANQRVLSLRRVIAADLEVSEHAIKLVYVDGSPVQDESSLLLHALGIDASSIVTVDVAASHVETPEGRMLAPGHVEHDLPGVLISADQHKFACLFELTQCKDNDSICVKAADLIAAIPTNVSLARNLVERVMQGGSTAQHAVQELLDEKATFQRLYNVQVLCGQMLPGVVVAHAAEPTRQFKELFIALGGVAMLFTVLAQPLVARLELHHQRSMLRICIRMLQDLLWHGIRIPREVFAPNKLGGEAEDDFRKQQSARFLATIPADQAIETLVNIAWPAGTGRWHCGTAFLRDLPADNDVSKADRWLALDAITLLSIMLQVLDELRQTVFQNRAMQDFVKEILLVSADAHVRSCARDRFKALITDDSTFSHVYDLMVSMLENVEVHSATCSEYFGLLCSLMNMLERRVPEGGADMVMERQIQLLFARGSAQRDPMQSTDSDDQLLAGRLQLTTALLGRLPDAKRAVGDQLIDIVMTEFLFPASNLLLEVRDGAQIPSRLPSDASGLPPMVGELTNGSDIPDVSQKCRSAVARQAAQKLLLGLATQCSPNYERIIETIYTLHFHAEDAMVGFEQSPDVDARPPSGYVGLKNAGATCYMNSVFQQLYMQPGLRAGLLRSTELEGGEALGNTVYHFKSMFESLRRSKMQSYTPTGFWKTYKHGDGTAINLREQRDAHSFFLELADQLDTTLDGQHDQKLFEHWFGGTTSSQKVVRKGCNCVYEKEEDFMSVNVQIRNCQTLLQSLEKYVEGDLLEGANAYMCENCGTKRDTVMRTCIKRPPQVLAIQLKRFDFDWERDEPVKFNDYFEFPDNLDIRPYTAEGLFEKDEKDRGMQGTASAPDAAATQYNYVLVGVLVHSGQANGGHYYSYIRERQTLGQLQDEKWLKFDDTDVTEEDVNMRDEFFGGEYQQQVWDPQSRRQVMRAKERWWNAYMLFYERKEAPTMETPRSATVAASKMEAEASGGATAPAKCATPDADGSAAASGAQATCNVSEDGKAAASLETATAVPLPPSRSASEDDDVILAPDTNIARQVDDQNLRFMHRREMFNSDYYDFILKLCQCNLGSSSQLGRSATRLAFKFFFTYLLRSDKHIRGPLGEWRHYFKLLTDQNTEASQTMLDTLVLRPQLYCDFLLACPTAEVRTTFRTVLWHSVSAVAKNSARDVFELLPMSEHILPLLDKDIGNHIRHTGEYFQLLLDYCSLGPKYRAQLLRGGVVEKTIKAILVDPVLNKAYHTPDFTNAYVVIAHLLRDCVGPFVQKELANPYRHPQPQNIEMPEDIQQYLFYANPNPTVSFWHAVHLAASSNEDICTMLKHILFGNTVVTQYLTSLWVQQFVKLSSGAEVVQAHQTLMRTYLCIDEKDGLQLERIYFLLFGFEPRAPQQKHPGVLDLLQNLRNTNPNMALRQIYLLLKLILQLQNKHPEVKVMLLSDDYIHS